MRITRIRPTSEAGAPRSRPRPAARALLAALPVAAALLVGACSSDDGKGSEQAAQSPAGAAAGLSDDERNVKYAECLRENGLDVADPPPGQNVQLQIDRSKTDKAMVAEAQENCRPFSPPQSGAGSGGQDNASGQQFAACMRENGVEEFPDPDPNQRGVRMSAEVQQDPDFQSAVATCQPIFSGGQGGQGQG
ncbi:hypothetical protein [Streptodolium elevatio]|uniref:Secreted protein n=1 Tax=Streptodolium elevatio TaxID=3157996 RepID=A0ABV3DT81_9ACTN